MDKKDSDRINEFMSGASRGRFCTPVFQVPLVSKDAPPISNRELDIEAGKTILLAAADEGAIDNFDDDDFVAVAQKARELFGLAADPGEHFHMTEPVKSFTSACSEVWEKPLILPMEKCDGAQANSDPSPYGILPKPTANANEHDELVSTLKALVDESTATEMLFADQRAGWKPPALASARALLARLFK